MPVGIFTVITLVYFVFIYRKVGVLSIVIKYLLNVLLPELTIIGAIAICRIPIAEYMIAMLVIIYSIFLMIQSYNLKRKLNKIKLEENKK